MSKLFPRLATMPALLLLSGCTDPVVAFKRTAIPQVERIGVLTPAWPAEVTVALANSDQPSIGLVNGFADIAMRAPHGRQLQAELDSRHYIARDRFEEFLLAAVAEHGNRVVPVSVQRSDLRYLTTYAAEGPADTADAWLDCVGDAWGYIAGGLRNSTPYQPVAHVACRLVRVSGHAILMRSRIAYNPAGESMQDVTLWPDWTFTFLRFDDLMADRDWAVKGIDDGLRRSAEAVGTL